ncbi:MAG: glycosyltransferase family 39 protein [Phycisphaerae bacterium]|nr:glycosyltransferase family 39 protein [Phycisphaerae bacterium]
MSPAEQRKHVGREDSATTAATLGIVTITLLGALLRFYGLGRRDFWFDESCTFIYVRDLLHWPEDSNLFVESTNLPYYVLLKGWSLIFGHSEAAYRSLSALLATLTIPILAHVAGILRGRRAAVICAAVVAFHPLHIHYAREARAYALWFFLLSISIYFLLRASWSARARWWMAFAAALWLTLVTHYFTAYFVPATLGAIFWAQDRRRFLRRWFVSVAAVAVLFLPYAWIAVLPAAGGGGNRWIADRDTSLLAILQSLWVMLPSADYPAHLRGLSRHSPDTLLLAPAWLAQAAAVLPIVLVALMGWAALRTRAPKQMPSTGGDSRAVHAPLLIMAVAPLLLAAVYSLIVRPNYLVGRYDLVAWPVFSIWFAVLIHDAARIAPMRGRAAAATSIVILLMACSALPVARMLALSPPPSFARNRAERLAQITDTGDLIVSLSYDRDYLQYYMDRAGACGKLVSFPSWLETQVGWVDTEADLQRLARSDVRKDLATQLERIEQTLRAGHNVWLLADSLDPSGTGPRGPINNLLLQSLRTMGYNVTVVDPQEMILAVTKPASDHPAAESPASPR